jgi:hypothetical protein
VMLSGATLNSLLIRSSSDSAFSSAGDTSLSSAAYNNTLMRYYFL